MRNKRICGRAMVRISVSDPDTRTLVESFAHEEQPLSFGPVNDKSTRLDMLPSRGVLWKTFHQPQAIKWTIFSLHTLQPQFVLSNIA